MAKIDKARFWTGVLYPENMRPDWQDNIGDTLQYPYAYCIHTQDKDSKSEHRKDHVHLIVAFPNTTTYKHALNVMDLLSADGQKAINKCEAVIGIRNVYDYLIHDTDDCRKKKKEPYPPEARITGNNFDIGLFEQLGAVEKNAMFLELGEAIRKYGFTNYMEFYEYVVDSFDDMNYVEVMRCYSGHFERLTRGNYQKWEQQQKGVKACPSQAHHHEITTHHHEITTENTTHHHDITTENTTITTEEAPISCPHCGSISVVKQGKTLANTQRWGCKDCKRKFVAW